MKKSLIALAVAAGSIAAAQADTTTLYGSIGFSSTIAKSAINTDGSAWNNTTGAVKDSLKSVKENHWNVKNDRARLGVKGTEDLSNGLQAVFKLEAELREDGDNGPRDAYVGLKGDFGQVTIGRQGATWNTDENFFRTSKPYKGIWTPDRESRTIKYNTPDFGGFKFAARVQADSANPASKGADQWDTSIEYKANGLTASAAYGKKLDTTVVAGRAPVSNGSTEALGVQVMYENDQYGVVGNVQHESSANTVYNVQGKYMFDANELRGGIGFKDAKNNRDEIAYGVGYQYNFSKRTSTWVEGVYNTVKHGKNDFTASVGIRHDF